MGRQGRGDRLRRKRRAALVEKTLRRKLGGNRRKLSLPPLGFLRASFLASAIISGRLSA